MIITPEQVQAFLERSRSLPVISIPREGPPTELICEHCLAPDGTYSTAVALIGHSVPHYHLKTREIYILRSGVLMIRSRPLSTLTPHEHVMRVPNEIHEFHPKTVHCAEGIDGPAEVLVLAWPPWKLEDHHVHEKAFEYTAANSPELLHGPRPR